jgi:apolipoprotein N-acyltransferase
MFRPTLPAAAPARVARFRRRWAALVVVAGGLLGVAAFPRFGFWPAAFVSVAALSAAVDGRRARTGAWLGYVYGVAFMVPLLSWTGVYVGPVPWLILALAEAGFFAALGAALPMLARLPAAPVWIAAGWVLEEALRDRLPFGGFPWGRLAFSQASSPLRWFAAVGGAPLVSFAVALTGGGVAVLWWAARPLRRGTLAGAVVVAVVVPVLGAVLSAPLGPPPDRSGRQLEVAVVQGGLPDVGLHFEDRAQQVLDNHIAQTRRLAADVRAGRRPRPDLVVWPENASDVDPFADRSAYAKIDAVVREIGVPVLVGAILQGPGPQHRRNVGILWSPTSGAGARYTKRHPVPFAEYIPLRGIAEFVSSAAKTVTQDMVAGSGNGVLRGGPAPIGDVICFEVAYDSLVRSSVAAGAELLVVQTNNATFGHTAETYQQLAMSRLRAVETGRTVVQAATTGKSAVIGPDGGIRTESGPLYHSQVLVARIPLRTATTTATRLGAWPEYLLSALGLAGVLLAALAGRRGPGGHATSDEDAAPSGVRKEMAQA